VLVAALAALHAIEMPDLPRFDAADELAIVAHWSDALTRWLPEHASSLRHLHEHLLAWAERLPDHPPMCVIHRDFYPSQVLFDGTTITLLDLDTLAIGSPCVDLGNLIAHLALDAIIQNRDAPFLRLLNHIRRTYEQVVGPVDTHTLAFYTVSSLARVAAVHALRCDTARHAPTLWMQANRLIKTLNTREVRSVRPPVDPAMLTRSFSREKLVS